MRVAITGYDLVSGLGELTSTWSGLIEGRTALAPLRFHDPALLGVSHGYQIPDDGPEPRLRPSGWLSRCVLGAVQAAGIDPEARRIQVVVGTGLRELRALERWAVDGSDLALSDLHFRRAVRSVLPNVSAVYTLANACSASGHALAVGADILAAGEADAVVVAGCDAMTDSMLAMIGRLADEPTTALRPFDSARQGVLLGEGAVAVVLQPESAGTRPLTRLLSTGLTCDAFHETGPDRRGIVAAMRDAHARAGVTPADIGLVLAHGTGTALNDPTEASALTEVFGNQSPLVTGIKGAIGHTSGAAAAMSLVVAVEALRHGRVPAIAGLTDPIPEAAGLRLVHGEAAPCENGRAQINSFGFGGVNAVSVVEVAA
ncbi:beta-ketoacyl synthase N-terminal-like domain-containing protein [Actinokineospora sp.]|uniref:beta-ketoacyl synthase N-terminal-like domain-containing protein n=1 Tax=Actinokineospora sp. TaxID=1872133 RepID=UPI003D6C2C75